TAQVVDLVDVAVALARGDRVIRGVVEAAHVDAIGRADAGTELATDAFLHPVLVTVEDVTTVLARLFGHLLVGILAGDPRPGQVLEGQLEPAQEPEVHQNVPPSSA